MAQVRAGGMGEVYEAQDIMRRLSWSFLQPRSPIDDHCDGSGACLPRNRVDQESLIVGGHGVRVPHVIRGCLKQRLYSTPLKTTALEVHRCRHQFIIGSEIEDLGAVVSPSRKIPTSSRDLPLPARPWEGDNINFVWTTSV